MGGGGAAATAAPCAFNAATGVCASPAVGGCAGAFQSGSTGPGVSTLTLHALGASAANAAAAQESGPYVGTGPPAATNSAAGVVHPRRTGGCPPGPTLRASLDDLGAGARIAKQPLPDEDQPEDVAEGLSLGTLVLGETQEATLERVRRELQAKQAQYDSLLRAMEAAPPAVL